MTTWTKVAGDIGDKLTVDLGGIATLSAATVVEAHVWRSGTAPVVLTGTVTDAEACTIEIDLGGVGEWLPGTEPGRWSIEFEVTFLDGSKLTWPQMGPDTVIVRSDHDPA